MTEHTTHKDNIPLGIASACLTFFLLTAMLALGKLLYGYHNAIEIVFYRNLIAVLPMVGYILIRKKYHLLKTNMPGALAFRVIVGTIAVILTFAAMQLLPMANATVIFFASTLIIPVLAHFYLKEHIGWHRWLAIAIGLSGVILIARPTLEFTAIGVALALGAAFGHAIIQIMLRHLKSENTFTVTFYFLFSGALLCGAMMPWVGSIPIWDNVLILLALGAMGGLAQYMLALTFKLAPASVINPFNYTGLIWATGFDIWIWNIVPTWHVFAGAAIIIASNLFIIYRENKKTNQIDFKQPQ